MLIGEDTFRNMYLSVFDGNPMLSCAQLLEVTLASSRLVWVHLESDCSGGLAHLLVRGVPGDRHLAAERLPENPKQRNENALARVAFGGHPDGAASQNYGP